MKDELEIRRIEATNTKQSLDLMASSTKQSFEMMASLIEKFGKP